MQKRLKRKIELQIWSGNERRKVAFNDDTILDVRDDCSQCLRVVEGFQLVLTHFDRAQNVVRACFMPRSRTYG